jgi:hypothetical protein
MGAKWTEKIQIDTSHFVCTTATEISGGASRVEYQRALQLSIPIVQPYWILACHTEKRYFLSFSHVSAPLYFSWMLG